MTVTMTSTDTIKAIDTGLYKAKEDKWFDDGREEELLSFVTSRCASQTNLDTKEVIKCIDEFGASRKYMMNVGAEKGRIVTSLIEEHKPQVMVELGGYIGYSTLLFADALKRNGGKRYISFERDPKFAKIAQTFVDLAGLNSIVEIIVGSSSKNLVAQHRSGRLEEIDMMFLDHYKPAYVRDLKICETLGMIRKGTVLAADNMIAPGNPPYMEYVRSSPEEKRRKTSGTSKETDADRFSAKTAHQYTKQTEEDDVELSGVPEIVYDSHMINSQEPTGEPDGVEITICKTAPSIL